VIKLEKKERKRGLNHVLNTPLKIKKKKEEKGEMLCLILLLLFFPIKEG